MKADPMMRGMEQKVESLRGGPCRPENPKGKEAYVDFFFGGAVDRPMQDHRCKNYFLICGFHKIIYSRKSGV